MGLSAVSADGAKECNSVVTVIRIFGRVAGSVAPALVLPEPQFVRDCSGTISLHVSSLLRGVLEGVAGSLSGWPTGIRARCAGEWRE